MPVSTPVDCLVTSSKPQKRVHSLFFFTSLSHFWRCFPLVTHSTPPHCMSAARSVCLTTSQTVDLSVPFPVRLLVCLPTLFFLLVCLSHFLSVGLAVPFSIRPSVSPFFFLLVCLFHFLLVGLSNFLSVRLLVALYHLLSVCLPYFLSTYRLVCPTSCLLVCLPYFLPTCWSLCLTSCWSICPISCLPGSLVSPTSCLLICLSHFVPTCLSVPLPLSLSAVFSLPVGFSVPCPVCWSVCPIPCPPVGMSHLLLARLSDCL